MANDLIIRISAIDKATAVVRKVNDSISKTLRPVTNVQRSLAMLGREAGLGRIGKSLGQVSRAAGDVAQKVGSIMAPLAAVVGVGSVAAIAQLAKSWANAGAEIGRTSEALGMSAAQLQGLRGAGQLVGMSTEALTGGIKGLGDTMQDAINGRAPAANAAMIALGLSFKRNADGAIDLNTAVHEIADGLARYKSQGPQAQTAIANALGVEQLLPLLRLTGSGIDELLAKVQATGAVMGGPQVAAARAFAQSLAAAELAVQGVRNTVASALLPILQPVLERLAAWASANRELIATRVAEFVDGLAKAVQSIDWNGVVAGVKSFVDGVRAAVAWVGGWHRTLMIVAVVMAGPLLASVLNLGAAMLNFSRAAVPFVALMGVGLVRAASAAMLQMGLLTATALPGLSNAFVSAGAFLETGLLAKLGLLAGSAGLVLAAGGVGYAIGTAIYKGIENTSLADKIGRLVTVTLAALGNKEAQAALEAELNAKAGLPPTVPGKRTASGKVGGLASDAPPVPTALAKVQAEADIQKLIGMGWTRAQAAGIAANVQRESGGNEKAVGDNGSAFGLAQWHPDRQAAFEKWAGKSMRASTRDEQLAFINYELRQGSEQGAGVALAGAKTADQAASIMSQRYERPADATGEAERRATLAAALYGARTGAPTGAPIQTPYQSPQAHLRQLEEYVRSMGIAGVDASQLPQPSAGVPQPPLAGPGAVAPPPAPAQGAIDVNVTFHNAPQGTKASVDVKGGVRGNTRINYTLPGVGVA
jgi:hypothetical protein